MENQNPFGDQETFTLNIANCIQDKSLPAVLRLLLTELRDNGYVNTGQFFQTISVPDLDMLSVLADYTQEDEEITEEESTMGFEHLALLGMALCVGEGIEMSAQSAADVLKLTITFIAIEGLHRKGLVEAMHENWSMDVGSNVPIVSKKV